MDRDQHRTADIEHRQLERLIFFSDAVFAIAITLLVLDLRLPLESHGVVDLRVIGSKLIGFTLSFAVIGAYWLRHHQIFGRVAREDQSLRVVNLVFLSIIVFLPFPTSIIASHVNQSAVIFYAASVAAAGFLMAALGLVARRAALADPDLGPEPQDAIIRSIPVPAVFLASIGVAQISPFWAMQSWWLIIPTSWFLGWLSHRSRIERSKGP